MSVLEYRKRGSPQVFLLDQGAPALGDTLAAQIPDAWTMFVTTAPPRDSRSLPAVAKVSWRPEWNGLSLKPREIARLLASSAAAPVLGLHARHLPAAVYWADGVAGASAQDLRFRGVPVKRVGMTN